MDDFQNAAVPDVAITKFAHPEFGYFCPCRNSSAYPPRAGAIIFLFLEKKKVARYFVELSYKGTNYHGWQLQPNALTVQEILNRALSQVLRQEISTTGSGRTDTGVHALQQFAHFDTAATVTRGAAEAVPGDAAGLVTGDAAEIVTRDAAEAVPGVKTVRGINALLPSDIAVRQIIEVHDKAHARFDAVSRSYQYHMHFAKDPFLHQYSWKTRHDFDLGRMNQGAALIREHTDFGCFCKSRAGSKTTICRLSQAHWEENGPGRVVFHISADRFLRNMVRAIVGTLLDVGRRKLSLDDLRHILQSGDRSAAGASVPPEGLYLSRVVYPYIN